MKKLKEMFTKPKMKQMFLQIFASKLGWMMVCLALCVVFGALANYYDWAYTAMLICALYPVGLSP